MSTTPYEGNINQRIRKLRNALQITQEKFGKSIGMQNTTISRMETPGYQITDKNIKMICKTYDVSPDWLRTGKGEMFRQTKDQWLKRTTDRMNLSSDEKECIRLFLNLPEPIRQNLIQVAVKIVKTTVAAQDLGAAGFAREEKDAKADSKNT